MPISLAGQGDGALVVLDFGSRGTGGAERNLRAIGRHAAHEAEMAAILATLEQVQWNRAEAARLLGVSYKTLLNKLNRAGVPGRIKTPLDPDATAS